MFGSEIGDLEYFDDVYKKGEKLHLIMNRRLYIDTTGESCSKIDDDTSHFSSISN